MTKTKKIAGFLLASTLLISCTGTKVIYGFERTVYIDYSQLRDRGIEVTDGNVPIGSTSIGQLSEIIRFDRVYKWEERSIPTNTNDDVIVPKRKTTFSVQGNFNDDIKQLSLKLSGIIKEKDGKGIAKINVAVTNADTHPIYHVTGIVYR